METGGSLSWPVSLAKVNSRFSDGGQPASSAAKALTAKLDDLSSYILSSDFHTQSGTNANVCTCICAYTQNE